MRDDYYEADGPTQPEVMPTMAETKVEDLRHILNRIERVLRPILTPAQEEPKDTSDSTPVRRPSKLLLDLENVLEYASSLEKRINL